MRILSKVVQLLGLEDPADAGDDAAASKTTVAASVGFEDEEKTIILKYGKGPPDAGAGAAAAGLLTIPLQDMAVRAPDPHTPATPPTDPEAEAKGEREDGISTFPSPASLSSSSTSPNFLDLELRIREIALQIRSGSNVECSTACLAMQRLAPGLRMAIVQDMGPGLCDAMLMVTRALLTVTPALYICSNDALLALQLLGSGDGQTACKDALVRVGAVTVLAAQLVAEGPLTQVMPAAPAACWMHLSPASLEAIAEDRMYHCLAALLNLLRSQEELKNKVVNATGLLPTIVMFLASCHDATRRAALSLLATIMIGSKERREAVALAGAIQPLERLKEGAANPLCRERARALLDELE